LIVQISTNLRLSMTILPWCNQQNSLDKFEQHSTRMTYKLSKFALETITSSLQNWIPKSSTSFRFWWISIFWRRITHMAPTTERRLTDAKSRYFSSLWGDESLNMVWVTDRRISVQIRREIPKHFPSSRWAYIWVRTTLKFRDFVLIIPTDDLAEALDVGTMRDEGCSQFWRDCLVDVRFFISLRKRFTKIIANYRILFEAIRTGNMALLRIAACDTCSVMRRILILGWRNRNMVSANKPYPHYLIPLIIAIRTPTRIISISCVYGETIRLIWTHNNSISESWNEFRTVWRNLAASRLFQNVLPRLSVKAECNESWNDEANRGVNRKWWHRKWNMWIESNCGGFSADRVADTWFSSSNARLFA
jgi:hypothetical protein